MKLDAAKSLLETVFASSYSRDNFKRLAAEVFNGYDRKEQTVYQEEKVKNLTNLGLFEDDKGKKIAVFETELLTENSLHRARVTQRNLIANQLKIHDYDSALCSFYYANQGEWRLSFITRESSIDVNSPKLNFIEHLSPSRRQSFIAGPNEGTHTAKKQFLPRIESSNKPSFDEIARIFAIEAVNDDFYEQYKELYLRLTEELERFIEKDPVIAADFKDKEVSASDFAKKTLGQFVFLYFLQRKGWIKDKAHPDDRFSFGKLFDDRKRFGDNFFNDLMEPIFYESLAKKEPNLEVYPVLHHYEFPYLNGGLFEPIRDYDWEETNIVISDTFFKNDNETNDGHGDGLIDVFNRFNFTVHENDPLEQDIAVDPEMLGKVFENLLEEESRKKDGAFYTPRAIVKYMCQESLIHYLVSKIGDVIPTKTLENFIKLHSVLLDNDISDTELSAITENAIDLDDALVSLKVCDPAVGSGAFLMGMLTEIVSARNFLQPHLKNKKNIYDLKLHTIGQSLYGVDLDPSAVEIARLRFWLSLIIEEDKPTPLPNLEHKLMQGNSLLSSFQGIELFNEQFIDNTDIIQEKISRIDEKIHTLKKELVEGLSSLAFSKVKARKDEIKKLTNKKTSEIKKINQSKSLNKGQMLFESEDISSRIKEQTASLQTKISELLLPETNEKKEVLKNEIDNIILDLIELSIDDDEKYEKFLQLKNKRIKPFFLWKVEFIDVFKNNNGFDLVIGNPPYVTYKIEAAMRAAYRKASKAIDYKFDDVQKNSVNLFAYFIERGISLLNEVGSLAFIVPHSVSRVDGYRYIRKYINENTQLWQIVDEYDQFNNVTLEMVSLFCSKNTTKQKYIKSRSNRENKVFQVPNNIYDMTGYYPIYYDDMYKKITQNPVGKVGGFRGFEIDEDVDGRLLYIGGKNVKSYKIETGHKEYFISDLAKNNLAKNLKKEEIVITQFGASPRGTIINTDKIVPSGGCVVITHIDDLLPKFVLALINSSVVKYFFDRYIVNNAGLTVHLDGHYLNKIPIPDITTPEQKPFVALVDKILKENNEDTTDLKIQLNNMIQKLYHLTNEESIVIEKIVN